MANRTVVCSEWLADQLQMPHESVVHQAVPRPPGWPTPLPGRDDRTPLVIGRICTPQSRKWPSSLVPFYRRLSVRHPRVRWEFVGCPGRLRISLQQACAGRATFHQASRDARASLWNWDAMLYHHPDLTESFGRTVAEAMRTGCVPIVDNRGGFREQIADGCGFLCDNEDDFLVAVAALQNRQFRRVIAKNARNFADRRFSLRSFRQRLLRQFASL